MIDRPTTTTWWSPRGTPLPPTVQQRVNVAVLARMYEAESTDAPFPAGVDSATRYAWDLGWRNPRVPGRAGGWAECHEQVTREGEYQPCEEPAVGFRDDPEGPYPVCAQHAPRDEGCP